MSTFHKETLIIIIAFPSLLFLFRFCRTPASMPMNSALQSSATNCAMVFMWAALVATMLGSEMLCATKILTSFSLLME